MELFPHMSRVWYYLKDGELLHFVEISPDMQAQHQLLSTSKSHLPVDVLPVDLISVPKRGGVEPFMGNT